MMTLMSLTCASEFLPVQSKLICAHADGSARPLFPQWSHHVYPQFLPGSHPAHHGGAALGRHRHHPAIKHHYLNNNHHSHLHHQRYHHRNALRTGNWSMMVECFFFTLLAKIFLYLYCNMVVPYLLE